MPISVGADDGAHGAPFRWGVVMIEPPMASTLGENHAVVRVAGIHATSRNIRLRPVPFTSGWPLAFTPAKLAS
jgi:hypothetical protein